MVEVAQNNSDRLRTTAIGVTLAVLIKDNSLVQEEIDLNIGKSRLVGIKMIAGLLARERLLPHYRLSSK